MCTNILRTLTLHNQPPVIIVAKHQTIIPMSPARGDSKVSSLIFYGNFFSINKCQILRHFRRTVMYSFSNNDQHCNH